MDWQQTISLCIVAFTAILFVQNAVRKKKRPSSSCGTCSGCNTNKTPDHA